MATKTVFLAEDADERLKRAKRDGERVSDVVRRLTAGVDLAEFRGALAEETADELEAIIAERRTAHAERRTDRRERVTEALDDPRPLVSDRRPPEVRGRDGAGAGTR